MLARLAGVAACALALTVVSPATAQAEAGTFDDGPGDVWTAFRSSAPSRVPDRAQGDILRTAFTHGQHQVVVRTRFVELKREGRILIFTQLRTNTGQTRGLALNAGPNFYRGRTEFSRRNGPVDCAVSHSIDYATNVAIVRVPRSCLGNPRTVQAKFGVATFEGRRSWADNPINHGPTDRLPVYTAPFRRG